MAGLEPGDRGDPARPHRPGGAPDSTASTPRPGTSPPSSAASTSSRPVGTSRSSPDRCGSSTRTSGAPTSPATCASSGRPGSGSPTPTARPEIRLLRFDCPPRTARRAGRHSRGPLRAVAPGRVARRGDRSTSRSPISCAAPTKRLTSTPPPRCPRSPTGSPARLDVIRERIAQPDPPSGSSAPGARTSPAASLTDEPRRAQRGHRAAAAERRVERGPSGPARRARSGNERAVAAGHRADQRELVRDVAALPARVLQPVRARPAGERFGVVTGLRQPRARDARADPSGDGSCRDPTTSKRCSRSTASTPTAGSPASSPGTRSGARRRRSMRGHELELARFHRLPPPMFMATGRLDAVWQHDGLLEVRDYKTGSVVTERIVDDPRAGSRPGLAEPIAERPRPAAADPLRAPRRRGRRRPGAVRARRRRPRRHRRGAAASPRRRSRPRPPSTPFPGSPTPRSAVTAATGRSAPRARRPGFPTWPTPPDPDLDDE